VESRDINPHSRGLSGQENLWRWGGFRGRLDAALLPESQVLARHRPDPWSVWSSSVWPQVIVFVLCVCFVILCLTFLDHPRWPEDNWNCNMGQSSSTSSPLQCMLTNFSSFQQKALDLGASCDAFTLRRLCEFDWPSFDVGWPAEGTFDLPTAYGWNGLATPTRILTFWPD
jgi:hypothetical protein